MPAASDGTFASVRGLEERAFNAWPALETIVADGWLLRFADGYTKRANSVNAWAPRTGTLEAARVAAPLYARSGLPLIVRLSPLAGTASDADLAAAGFARMDETIVMTAAIGNAMGSRSPDDGVRIAAIPTPHWCDGFAAANQVPGARRAIHDRMLQAIRFPAAFATIERDGAPLGLGLAVAERGMVGLFDIVTAPHARRQGVARRLVEALLAWGRTERATGAYLQVVATNLPAITLYRSMGFAEAYRYHYRIASGS